MLAGKDSHGANAHNWGEGVDLLSNALTEESGLNIETEILKVDGQTPVFSKMQRVSLSYRMVEAGIQLIKALRNLMPCRKGVGLVCVHYAVEVPKVHRVT